MIMEPYHKKEFQSIRVKKDNRISHKLCFRCRPLCRLLEYALSWNGSRSYRIPGKLILSQRIILFDLARAVVIGSQDSMNRGVNEYDREKLING